MRLLNAKQVDKLFSRQGFYGGKSGPLLNKALQAKVGESVLLLQREWSLAADPGSILALSSKHNKNGPLFGRSFRGRTLPDKSGWIFTRVV